MSQSAIGQGERVGRKLCSSYSKSTLFPKNEMDYVDVHGIPRHLSQAASSSVPEESDAQHWHTASLLFSWKERAKWNLWMAASGIQLFVFPSFTLPISLFSFLLLLDRKFHSSWKGPKYNCWVCTEKATIVEEKKTYRNRVTPLGSAKLNTGAVSACICI